MLYGIYMLMQVSRLLSTYMLIDTVRTFNIHTRIRNDKTETVKTIGTDYILQCDKCGVEFARSSKHYRDKTNTHYCKDCYSKPLAQLVSAKTRKINRYVEKFDASSGKPLGTFKL